MSAWHGVEGDSRWVCSRQFTPHAHGTSLREAAVAVGGVSEVEFDAWVRPASMAGRPGA